MAMTTASPDATEPLVVRDFDVPRSRIFDAWTDPGQLSRWISPKGCTAPRALITIDLRIGGRYDYCLVQTSDGTRFWMRQEITALEPSALLAFTSGPMPEHGHPDPVTTRVELREHAAGTRMAFIRPYPAERRPTAAANWNRSFDHLSQLVATP
ncbi:SRPBCC family protein [Actinomadura madurae]|uniref:SRPBCC family protein n=1 Tax=Actinomadura madurae TaxID=1993 RepID=UPI002026233B|nr:SRPBCC family protein [Actinomadura madurae]MCP9949512.1 SRPBCC domain-containing protein [Actinomadura madurae]MCP9966267.1 SRPBCC domain-containing protein [Actinomadura madurae]MCP9978759.1 SRPBCC domain-containing protein [Actinomadura madurae]MCQ0009722.1 SRPBCC domain-containing protein [Actinomadura madurae]MCQ0014949.1 SRPBCC domain-containing protein [Actinomadura madurae]